MVSVGARRGFELSEMSPGGAGRAMARHSGQALEGQRCSEIATTDPL